jgi:hypothetical protein
MTKQSEERQGKEMGAGSPRGRGRRKGGSGECRAGLKAASSCAGAAETGGDQ